jgi:predicted nucleic acid-binding protein
MISVQPGAAVYVDTNIFIYFLEPSSMSHAAAAHVFEHLSQCRATIVTSELTLAECLFKPSRDGDAPLIAVIERAFGPGSEVALIPLNGSIVLEAARTGGRRGLKLLDAIHLVSAINHGCELFVTADVRFRSLSGLPVLIVD